jgi:uncharacterized protein (TIGR03000 family)
MTRHRSIIPFAFVCALAGAFVPNRAEAQIFGRSAGVGVGIYSGSPYAGPSVGVYPLYYPGFYGNGMSMYGPPVPTYGIVPGTFGGSDYRVNQNAPFLGTGSGLFFRRSTRSNVDSARSNPKYDETVAVPSSRISTGEPPLAEDAVLNEPPLYTDPSPKPSGILMVEVRVPNANAIVYVNNQPTRQSGVIRTFASPQLPEGDAYEYDVRVEWTANGRRVSRTKTINGKPGENLVVDFTR